MKNTNKGGQDLSLISYQLETGITVRYFDHYKDKIKQVKYPTFSISNAENLDKKIESFKDEHLRVELKRQISKINSLRKIRGDGNCFFRALAFACISKEKDIRINLCFKFLDQLCLTCCTYSSIPKQFTKFYFHNFLKFMLVQNWEKSYRKCLMDSQDNHRVALIKLFDEYPYLDFICVLYFRAVCLKGLWLHRDRLKEFLVGNEEEAIRTYSEETEGVSINICSVMLRVLIHVYEVRKGKVLTYHYDQVEKPKDEIHLLFYENHYDLLEINDKIEAEENTLKQSEYYSAVSRKTTRGICIQCNKQKRVFEDSAICQTCFDMIQSAAKRYDKQKLVSGRCQDCRSYRDDIVEDMRICKRCIKVQNQVQQRQRKERQMLKDKKFKRGKCQNCRYYEEVIEDIDLCKPCWRKQLQLEQKMQNMKLTTAKKSDDRKVSESEVEKLVAGNCRDCRYYQHDINSELGICQKCIKQRRKLEQYQIKKIRQAQSPAKKPNTLFGKKCRQCDIIVYSDKNVELCQKCKRNYDARIKVKRVKAVCQKCRLLHNNVSQVSKMCEKCEQITQSMKKKQVSVIRKCFQCTHYTEIDEQTGMCFDCTKDQKYAMGKMQKINDKKRDDQKQKKQDQFQRFKLEETKKVPAQKDQYPNRVIDQDKNINLKRCLACDAYKPIYENTGKCKQCYLKPTNKDYCQSCHHKREVSAQTKLCKQCQQIKNMKNQRPASTNKKGICMKCRSSPIMKQNLCQICYKASFCISCNQIKLTDYFINKVCFRCRGKKIH